MSNNKADGSTRLTTTEQHAEHAKAVAGLDHIPDSDQHRAVDPSATRQPISQNADGLGKGPELISTSHQVEIICGPLLNYKRMSNAHTDRPQWHGSVLLVAKPGNVPEELSIRSRGPTGGAAGATSGERKFPPEKLFEDPRKGFWRYEIDVPFEEQETAWEYIIPRMITAKDKKPLDNVRTFVVPSKHESMRIMFHSCNGFSVGTDMDQWTGPVLWNDVLRVHEQQPFHVMIGGGDQIYNDGVRVDGPLAPWTAIGNPRKRREFPFNEEMRAKCDNYYFDNYVRWYGTEPFATANSQIAQLNIWDDHDIIDGFGSYTDHFMKCSVFRGIGGVAHKYYLLFQHHIPPPPSTYTTDAPQTTKTTGATTAADSVQLRDTFVMMPKVEDPSFIIGTRPGPYVEERSRNIYCQLGKRIAFLGIDARTERTRHQINYPETYDLIFRRAGEELAKSNGTIKHLILLLGVPIAYPRLQWLENILSSPIIGPIKFLNKRFGVAGGVFNKFDGGVDLLDDLDDHYTAHQHKKERKALILRLQELSKQHSIRITILGGDVHLAALGRFYSKPELNIPAERDHRYMPNIVSSAITNKPPPQAVANLLARRNKIHHLDHETDETLLEMFDKNPGEGLEGVKPKTASNNHATMPSRNYAIIAESHFHTGNQTNGDPAANGISGINGAVNGEVSAVPDNTNFTTPKNPREPLHKGEEKAGTQHPAAGGVQKTGLAGLYGLDVSIKVEIQSGRPEGDTEGYGISIPALDSGAYKGQGSTW
ncbi:hypothetical protein CLAFUW4_01712 [Fulvia fulva]|uniref:PhoD-like phosphatase domain-containing protein n=1 Tax=Passalora fulva TaxID=5499 RepID=A0A9Q8P2C7_PASFU|nr:uncharacterized protein CLAFUR5_01709 [Fulvia fulva]KAK4636312.1 hypothetical protein CLAFUR4_01710 [Fulvia fulva]KAK4637851.1 hypothetical protein CLAFUR0_01711 [Fulvia fulva]UJO10890.1 hypothetical protein CLAFUR5_01709 [Fulvia fulva]WPV09791.1 hypothetical protein CLAFUW4_01712 [Fulvia fulva]WPV23389.1 hypothetical protein CLAFUW7_01714 [Fulvia fulva]